jgi:protein gp37
MANRQRAMGHAGYAQVVTDGRWNGKTVLLESVLDKPLHWKRPRVVFVNSMGDLFHESTPNGWLCHVFDVISACPQHTFILCTKRAKRMCRKMAHPGAPLQINEACGGTIYDSPLRFQWPLPNVIGMVTAENQEQWDARVPWLLKTPFARRWVSIEPMLGPMDLREYLPRGYYWCAACGYEGNDIDECCSSCENPYPHPSTDGITPDPICDCGCDDPESRCPNCGVKIFTRDETIACGWEPQPPARIDGVIVGGENGPGARSMYPDWVRKIRDDCAAAGVKFHFKGSGGWSKTRLLDGRTHDAMPEVKS